MPLTTRKRSRDSLSREEIKQFQHTILEWYRKNKRDLPWRQDRDPYHILVSEVMLQQTQVSRVIPKYTAWLQAFPTFARLAKASTREVLLQWSGLGYNRRALYLQKCAQEVVEKFNGAVPQEEKTLRQLPGIGEYTAKALLCFAFDKQVAVVDTNVRKVILTQIVYRHPEFISGPFNKVLNQVQHDKKMIGEIAQELLPTEKAYEWNQALMDYAAAELKAHKIPIKKQSKFKDSDRYYRGLMLKLLLKEENQTFESLFKKVSAQNKIESGRYKKILLQLEKEKLITLRKGLFYLGGTNDD